MSFEIGHGATVQIHDVVALARSEEKLIIDPSSIQRVQASRDILDEFVSENRVIYGVNTSVGGFAHMLVPPQHAETLQRNLINAAATNVGPLFEKDEVRAAMVARVVSLARGNSAISLGNLLVLVEMINAGITPQVPTKGSLGTSGDLGPLACIALAGCGEWRSDFNGSVVPSIEALREAGIEPMKLSYKEGLALINGTSAMVGLGALVLSDAQALLDRYLEISALSIEALQGATKPFDPRVHALKPHRGQMIVAQRLWRLLEGSRMAVDEADLEKEIASTMSAEVHSGGRPIEDAYSIRCTPQVLGPVFDTIQASWDTVTNELNSSNDNPLILPELREVFHNGHFHGQYVAMAMDSLSTALVVMCNLADRRTDRFLTSANSNGLPGFLCREDPGLRLGLMGGQFMATSLTAENRTLGVPISTQSLPSTGDFQDIISLGLVAARRAKEILDNARYILAFELLCACQAADIRGIESLSPSGRTLYEWTREFVPYLDHDIVLTSYLEDLATNLLDTSATAGGVGA